MTNQNTEGFTPPNEDSRIAQRVRSWTQPDKQTAMFQDRKPKSKITIAVAMVGFVLFVFLVSYYSSSSGSSDNTHQLTLEAEIRQYTDEIASTRLSLSQLLAAKAVMDQALEANNLQRQKAVESLQSLDQKLEEATRRASQQVLAGIESKTPTAH